MNKPLFLVFLTVTMHVSACKDEAPKQQPPPVSQNATTQQTSSNSDNTLSEQGTNQTDDTDDGDDTNSGSCSKNTEPEITASPSGNSSSSVNFSINSNTSISFSADDNKGCEFAIYKIEGDNLPSGITITNNESDNVRVSGTVNQGTSSSQTGNITVYARNITACAKKFSKSECSDFDQSGSSDHEAYDASDSFSWSIGNNNSQMTNSDSGGKSAMLMMGLGLFTSMLSGGNPLTAILGGNSNNSLIGGGLNNQLFPGNQLGMNNNNNNVSCQQLNQNQCQQYQQCMLQGQYCVMRSGNSINNNNNCTNIYDQTQCRNSMSCLWSNSRCVSSSSGSSCTNLYDENQCRNAGCYWSLNRCSQL